ncbi:MAG: hypothetical protein ACOYO1_17895 [Bacteroidales bacterium]
MKHFDIFIKIATKWSLSLDEYFFLKSLLEELKPKKILEFGPGNSTVLFSKYAKTVESYENDQEWLKKYFDIYKQYKLNNISISLFENIYPLTIIPKEKYYDLIFVDAPWGGWECPNHPTKSRFNTMSFASKYTDKIILHDTKREREINTIQYFEELGWKTFFFNSERGMTFLYREK